MQKESGYWHHHTEGTDYGPSNRKMAVVGVMILVFVLIWMLAYPSIF